MISCEMEDIMLYQDIPRIYTAIAEWGSCLVYLYILKKENMKSVHFLTGSLFMLAMQSIFLTLTGSVTEILSEFYGSGQTESSLSLFIA